MNPRTYPPIHLFVYPSLSSPFLSSPGLSVCLSIYLSFISMISTYFHDHYGWPVPGSWRHFAASENLGGPLEKGCWPKQLRLRQGRLIMGVDGSLRRIVVDDGHGCWWFIRVHWFNNCPWSNDSLLNYGSLVHHWMFIVVNYGSRWCTMVMTLVKSPIAVTLDSGWRWLGRDG